MANPRPKPNDVYVACLDRITDGDTIHVFQNCKKAYVPLALRLARVNTDELPTPTGVEAMAYTAEWLVGMDRGFPLTIQIKGEDRWGRTIAEVWRNKDDHNISDDLLTTGHAKPYPKPKGVTL